MPISFTLPSSDDRIMKYMQTHITAAKTPMEISLEAMSALSSAMSCLLKIPGVITASSLRFSPSKILSMYASVEAMSVECIIV